MWVNRTLQKVSRTGVNGSTPGDIFNSVRVVEHPSSLLIGIVPTSPPYGLNASHQIANRRQSASPSLFGQTQNWRLSLTKNLTNDINSESIFRKVVGHKLFDSSSGDLYMRCRMNFMANPVQIQTPQFTDLGFSTTNTLDESSGLSTPLQNPKAFGWCPLEHTGTYFWLSDRGRSESGEVRPLL